MKDTALGSLCEGYGMPPSALLPELPSSGVSMLRFTRTEETLSQYIEHHTSSYTLALTLKPTRSHAWCERERVWSGAIPANSVNILPPDLGTRFRIDGEVDFLVFCLPVDRVTDAAGSNAAKIDNRLREKYSTFFRDDIVTKLGRLILGALGHNSSHMVPFADGLSLSLMAHIIDLLMHEDAGKVATLSPLNTQRVISYIRANLSGNILIKDLAEVAGLSESHFAHGFRGSVGEAPYSFINSLRIEKACELILKQDLCMSAIAAECGFGDASHFGRVFRSRMGLTPRQFRGSNTPPF